MRIPRALPGPEATGLVVLTLLAFALRAWRVDLMEFKHDEAVAWIRAAALAEGVEFPLTGLVSSKQLDNFPLFLYLIALLRPVLQWPHQIVLGIALLNSLAVPLIFAGARTLLSARVAWLTVILYAVSPCAIAFSRKLWAQDLLPFWGSAMFCLAALLVAGQPHRRRSLSALFTLLAVTSWQIHFSALFVFAAYGAVMVLNRKAFDRVGVLVGAICGAIPALPYTFYQLSGQGTGGVTAFGEQAASFDRFRLKELINYFVRQPVDEGYHAMLGPAYAEFLSSVPGYGGLRYFLSFMVMGGFLLMARSFLKGDRQIRKQLGLVLLLVMIPLSLMGISRIPLIPSYFLVLYPLPFLLAAVPLAEAWTRLEERLSPVFAMIPVAALIVIITGYQLVVIGRFQEMVAAGQVDRGDYGISYGVQVSQAKRIKHEGQSAEVLTHQELPILALLVVSQVHTLTAAEGVNQHYSSSSSPVQEVEVVLTAAQKSEAESARKLALELLQRHAPSAEPGT